jgi:hypothetical protein
MSRQHNDGDVVLIAFELASDLNPIHMGEVYIQQDDLRPQTLHQTERLFAIYGLADNLNVIFQTEGAFQSFPKQGVIVNDQNLDCTGLPAAAMSVHS